MTLDQNNVSIQYAIGYAIQQWGSVEDSLCHTYAICVGGADWRNFGPASAAYWATHSFHNRLAVTDAAVQQVIARPCILKTWGTMRERLRQRNKKRNQLAHFAVMHNYKPDGTDEEMVVPYHSQSKYMGITSGIVEQMKIENLDTPHRMPPKIKGYNSRDVMHRAKAFKVTEMQMRLYNKVLRTEITNQKNISSTASTL